MKPCVKWVLFGSVLLLSSPVWAAKAHVHGKAGLEIVVEGDKVSVALESPLDGLFGFERPPRNAAEIARVKAAVTQLRAPARQFVFTPAAGCKPTSVRLASAAIDAGLLGEPASGKSAEATKADAPRSGESEHADLDGDYVFQCTNVAALTSLDVRLFDSFKGLRQLNVQLVTPRKQKAARLTPDAPSLRW